MILWVLFWIIHLVGAEEPLAAPDAPYRRALVLGLDGKIGDSATLTAAEGAARSVAAALSGAGFHKVEILTGAQVTRGALDRSLARLATLNLRPQDTLVIYVTGHGTSCGALGDPTTQFIALADSREGDRCWEPALSDQELLTTLRSSRAGHRALVIDACYTPFRTAGSTTVERTWIETSAAEVVLRSTSIGLPAYQDGDRLLYTAHFVEGLGGAADMDGNGAITATEAHDHAARAVARRGAAQVPSRVDRIAGLADEVILAGEPGISERSVLDGLPSWGTWSWGSLLVPLGPAGRMVYSDEGPLELHDSLGVALRVRGKPARTGQVRGAPWVAGRHRGWPDLVVSGVGTRAFGLETRAFAAPGPLEAGLRLHEQALPALGIAVEGAGTLAGGVPRLSTGTVIASGEAHWRRISGAIGLRGSLVALRPANPDAAVSDALTAAPGAELSVRLGLGGPFALRVGASADRFVTCFEGCSREEGVVLGALSVGLLVDPAMLRSERF